MGIIRKLKTLSYEKKTLVMTLVSIGLQVLLTIGKFVLSIFEGVFFFVAAVVNIFAILAKVQTCLGIAYPNKRSLEFRNNLTSLFVCLMGIVYSVYMSRLLFTDIEVRSYGMILGILIACISFVELGLSIHGCVRAYGKGHYLRNAKLIDLCITITALVLTEIAITSFASSENTRIMDGTFGVVAGLLIVIIGIYMYAAPKLTIEEHRFNIYLIPRNDIKQYEKIKIQLTHSKIYGNYIYEGLVIGDQIEGVIKKQKGPIESYPILFKILFIIVAVLLCVPYSLGSLFFHLQGPKIVRKLDNYMINKGYLKVEI